eukprot:7380617-Prymnesium_polylepis.1
MLQLGGLDPPHSSSTIVQLGGSDPPPSTRVLEPGGSDPLRNCSLGTADFVFQNPLVLFGLPNLPPAPAMPTEPFDGDALALLALAMLRP